MTYVQNKRDQHAPLPGIDRYYVGSGMLISTKTLGKALNAPD